MAKKLGYIITILISSSEHAQEMKRVSDFFITKGPELQVDLRARLSKIGSGLCYYRGDTAKVSFDDIKTIFFVDDDVLVHPLIKMGFKNISGISVVMCSSGVDLISKLGEQSADLIILDVMMPEMTGTEVNNKLKEIDEYKDIPCIFLTAKNRREEINELLSLGAVGVIRKPFKPKNLFKIISKIIG